VALGGTFAIGLYVFRDEPDARVAAPPTTVYHQGPLFGIGPFPVAPPAPGPPRALEQVRLALAQAYYRHVSPLVLANDSIAGILKTLDDPYTEYLRPSEYEALQERVTRRYSGVGLTVGPGKGGLVVTSSEGGPAWEAGIRPGDVIVSIDGQAAGELPFDQSLALIKGTVGTTVRLSVKRPGEREVMRFEVVRQRIVIPAVRSRMISMAGRRIGYLRLLAFPGDAAARLQDATERLIDRRAEGFILDLRGDPGGYLVQAVRVASLFLDKGVVCSTSGVNQPERVYTVSGAAIETKRPLVVLVDHDTGSAAEIVAGALRDDGRALLVGRRTYGKATVQSLIALSNGGALKLTTATYRTPSGSSIGGKGLKPKVKASDNPETRPDEAVVVAGQVLLERLSG
jgi:carboxyl-terminal processing protease